jgi:2-polyprenyl-3-methyl-5-hydroxy-6-metoxy-1,4-benzoquinol methylase
MQFCRKAIPKGHVLDVGSGYGFFLKMMRNVGYSVHGVELSQAASRYAIHELGLPITHGTLDSLSFPDNTFDIITAVAGVEMVLKSMGHPVKLGTGVAVAQELLMK